MKKESSIIDTKEKPINNFSKEHYLIEKEDRQIMRLEKTCNVLSTVLKLEMAITLVVVTFAFIFNGFPNDVELTEKYKRESASIEVDYGTKI